MNFEINLLFLIKLFLLHDQKVKQKFRYLENEKSFYGEIKNISHQFYRTFIEANKTKLFGR